MNDIDVNRLELLAEDLEAYHLAMDDEGVPRTDLNGEEYSAFGRALVYAYVIHENATKQTKSAK